MNKKILSSLMVLAIVASCGKGDDYTPGGKTDPQPSGEIDKSTDKFIKVRDDVPLRAFHADVFSDGGIHASSMTNMPAADMLGLSFECLITESSNYTKADSTAQDNTFIGYSMDLNGKLLYPDGAPRYKVVFVNGGNATGHGRSLKPEGRANFMKYVNNGGSYIGSCAGAYMAALGSATELHDVYIGLWPGRVTNCNLSDTYVKQYLDSDSPLLQYYSWENNEIDLVYHNGGPCYDENMFGVPGTEILTRYNYDHVMSKETGNMNNKGAIWAYKKNNSTGRVIMSGSHPENVKTGARRDLMAGMLRYAIDGLGCTTVKAILHNNETISMDKVGGDPEHTMIGDMQCHHFVMWVPEGTKKVKVTLQPGESKFDFRLMLAKETFAYVEDAQYKYESKGGKAAVAELSNLTPGQWYICVQCTSDVKAVSTSHGTGYESTTLLNGTPYTISLSLQ